MTVSERSRTKRPVCWFNSGEKNIGQRKSWRGGSKMLYFIVTTSVIFNKEANYPSGDYRLPILTTAIGLRIPSIKIRRISLSWDEDRGSNNWNPYLQIKMRSVRGFMSRCLGSVVYFFLISLCMDDRTTGLGWFNVFS